MKKGIFCISIDHEMMWGRSGQSDDYFTRRVKKERDVIKKILRLFKKYDIPATWAIVGKITEKGNYLWSGKDTLNEIKKIHNQELAFHSYSHKIFDEISKEEAIKELSTGKIGASFVFPQNIVSHLDLLKENGFLAFRGKDKNLKELILPRIPPVYLPTRISGVINIPGSLYFVSARSLRRFIPFGLRTLKSILGLNRAIKEKKIFHLWFHPVDFVDNSKLLFCELEMILRYASGLRKKNLLEIKSMSSIVEENKNN